MFNLRSLWRKAVQAFSASPRKRVRRPARIRPEVQSLEDRTVPATFTVNTTVDGVGPGTIRWAITQANQTPNLGVPDLIDFNIGGRGFGVTITLNPALGPLGAFTEAVTIDGYSQGGMFGPIQPWVEIHGAGLQGDGLRVDTGGSTIKGLAVTKFVGTGILLRNPEGSPGNLVYGNYVGTDLSGTAAQQGNLNGIVVDGANNTIGMPGVGSRNVISGNTNVGLTLTGLAEGTVVVGNYIGTTVTGNWGLKNFTDGVYMESGSHNNIIGGAGYLAGNVISANGANGIAMSSSNNNQIVGNLIGVGANGFSNLGNTASGISISGTSEETRLESQDRMGAILSRRTGCMASS
jgi:hypothetical protein